LSKFSTYKFVLFHIFHNFVYAYFKALLWVTGQKVAQSCHNLGLAFEGYIGTSKQLLLN